MVFVCNIAFDPVGSMLLSIILLGLSGIPGLLFKQTRPGQLISVALTLPAALCGMAGALQILGNVPASHYLLYWPPPLGPFELSTDPLSALFLLPLFLAAGCCSVYGLAYLPSSMLPAAAKRFTLFSGLLSASMALVLIAQNGVLLLFAWEIMALSSWFLLMSDPHDSQVEKAGTIYLLATHTGTMALFVLFSLLKGETGTFAFPAAHSLVVGGAIAAIMLPAALIGFGSKAGIMPLHIWLPSAHANAPSHASALMSGIMLKIGLYGILRTASFFKELPGWFCWLVLALGIISALTGIVLACSQRDMKRLLACSSIENIGIVCIGSGMALVGTHTGNLTLAVFGLTGAFMHIINHALFKPLLFLGSGVVIHAAGTRMIDRMGGLSRALPVTAPLFMLGSLAICGLPPLNGFVGELFLYFGAFNEGLTAPLPLVAFIAPILALVGGLAVITFVKLYGMIFLGISRNPVEQNAHEAPFAMLLPMSVLAVLCLVAGIFAPLLLYLVGPAVIDYAAVSPAIFNQITATVPLKQISVMNGILVMLIVAVWLIWHVKHRSATVTETCTWGCGYLAPTARMQYNGSSFSELASGLFKSSSSLGNQLPGTTAIFPAVTRFAQGSSEWILDKIIIPFMLGADWCLSWLRRMQHGHLYLYFLYIFATLFVLMAWSHK